ncbi:MAG: type II secretion system F family protein [Thermoplasmatota archaeon]
MANDRSRKSLLDLLVVVAMLGIVAVALLALGFSPLAHVPTESLTVTLAVITALLSGATFLFNKISWEDLEAKGSRRILSQARTEFILTTVSLLALIMAVIMFVVEVAALWVFVRQLSGQPVVGAALLVFSGNFVLIQAAMLLVYLLAILARESHLSRHTPGRGASVVATILTPLAGLALLIGSVLALGLVHLPSIRPTQAVYVVTLGVLLEFLAMRIRLHLPPLGALFRKALQEARTADPEEIELLRRKARTTYVVAILFVALSMGLVAAVAAGVSLGSGGTVTGILVIYGIFAVVVLGLVVVRVMQARHDPANRKGDPDDELAGLVARRRRNPQEVIRIAVYIVSGFLAMILLTLCVLTGLDQMPWDAKFATDLFILTCVVGAGPWGFLYNREIRRIAAIDEKFPDFLRDIAESNRAGMTLTRALVTAAGGTYGSLTPEIKQMAAQVGWGVAFGDAMLRFADRCRTPLIDRTVALITEAQKAGGSMVDILTAASEDAREIKQIVSERTAQMKMYNLVVYITYFVFIVVVLVLSLQFIPAFKNAVGAAGGGGGQSVGGLKFHEFDPQTFNTLFFDAAVVQAIGGGLVGGVLTQGSPVSGFMNAGIMMLVAELAFRVGLKLAGQ